MAMQVLDQAMVAELEAELRAIIEGSGFGQVVIVIERRHAVRLIRQESKRFGKAETTDDAQQ